MANNLYHLLRFIPATEAWEMPPALEALAEQLVRSGKLRINADSARNYVRLGASNTDKTLTARELSDPALLPETRKAITRYVAPAEGVEGINRLLAQLYGDLKKARGVAADKEMKVARVLVQSAHPSVIQLLLQSGTELFVSYSHNVADLMQVKDWETHGKASGMQATESAGTAVFVSASGDPFFEGEHKTYTTDGFPALARMVVIAGQELGHFSDLRRAQDGRILGRYSTDAMHSQLRADPVPGAGRIADMTQVARLKEAYHRAGLSRLRRAEHGVAFYHKRWRYSPPWWFYQSWRFMAWLLFLISCKNRHIHLKLGTYPYHRHGEALELYLADMAFNLAPDADVYRNPDPLVEEAIAVIEAVARVPQQVHKWGHSGVRLAWPNLYRFYYSTIIPGCMRAVPQPISAQNINKLQLFKARLRRRFRPRPGYYP